MSKFIKYIKMAIEHGFDEKKEKKLTKLVKTGVDINEKDANGDTALVMAAEKGNEEVVKYLLKVGADVNAKNNYDATALTNAAFMGQTGVIKLLIEAGADINAKNQSFLFEGYTALMMATFGGYTEAARLLMKEGADLNVKASNGLTALGLAGGENSEIAKLLIEAGAKGKKNKGKTVSEMKVSEKQESTVEQKVEKEGSENRVNEMAVELAEVEKLLGDMDEKKLQRKTKSKPETEKGMAD